MSSTNPSANTFAVSTNTLSIKRWKVAGAFFKPNGITLNCHSPLCVKGSFLLVAAGHRDLPEPLIPVNNHKELHCLYSLENIVRVLHWVLVGDSYLVQLAVINA